MTVDITANSQLVTAFNIKNRKIWSFNQKWNAIDNDSLTLEPLRDMLRGQRKNQAPHDFTHLISRCKVEFNQNGAPTIKFLKRAGVYSAPCVFSKRGWDTLMGFVAPARLRDWESLAMMDEMGLKITEMAVNKLMQSFNGEVFFRTALTKVETADGEKVVRMLRSIQSASSRGYTVVDNLGIIEQLLLHGDFKNTPILQCRIEDEAFKLRFAHLEIAEMKMELNKTYPVTGVKNSEIGKGSIVIGAEGLRPFCDNGMASTTIESIIRLVHRGSEDRIIDRIIEEGAGVVTGAMRVSEQYNRSLEIEIDDLHAQMEAEFENLAKQSTKYKLSETEKDLIYASMSDVTSSPLNCLAGGVDAITFAAKGLPLNRASDIESMAFDYMVNSVRSSVNDKILMC